MSEFAEIRTAGDVTEEVLDIVKSVFDGWFANDPRIDWPDFLDRVENYRLDDDRQIDLGTYTDSEAIRTIKTYVRALRRG